MLGGMDVLLHGIISDAQIEMFAEAVQAMENFKYYDTTGQISIYLSGAAQDSPIVIQDMVFQYINEGLDSLLNAFEIMPVDADITMKTEMLRGMYYMENTDDSLFVVQTIENGEDAFINLLAHFTGQTQDYFYPHVSVYDTTYLEKLEAMHRRLAELLVEDISKVNEVSVTRTKKYLETYVHTLAENAAKIEMYKPGVAHDILLNKYRPNLNALYPAAVDQLAVEVIGLLCLSGLPSKAMRTTVNKVLNEFIPDEAAVARLTVTTDRILMEQELYA